MAPSTKYTETKKLQKLRDRNSQGKKDFKKTKTFVNSAYSIQNISSQRLPGDIQILLLQRPTSNISTLKPFLTCS